MLFAKCRPFCSGLKVLVRNPLAFLMTGSPQVAKQTPVYNLKHWDGSDQWCKFCSWSLGQHVANIVDKNSVSFGTCHNNIETFKQNNTKNLAQEQAVTGTLLGSRALYQLHTCIHLAWFAQHVDWIKFCWWQFRLNFPQRKVSYSY